MHINIPDIIPQVERMNPEQLDRLQEAVDRRRRQLGDEPVSAVVERRSYANGILQLEPSGEEYVWHTESGLTAAEISAEQLETGVRKLATATLVARHLLQIRDDRTGEAARSRSGSYAPKCLEGELSEVHRCGR